MPKKNLPSDFKDVNDAIEYLHKKYGKESILSKNTVIDVERVKTGLLEFDKSIGGGIPRGRVIELFGDEGCGKTTFALSVAALYQKNFSKSMVLYLDFENALDLDYAVKLGVSIDDEKWKLSQPPSLEEGMEILKVLVSTGAVSLVIVDSVAAMTPLEELEGTMEDHTIGAQARAMGKAFRKLSYVIRTHKVTAIFINQMRDKIGGFGTPYVTPGGKALKFYSSIRIRVNAKNSAYYSDEGGKTVTFNIVKNKTSIHQKQKTVYELVPGFGFSKEFELFDKCVDIGLIKQNKRKYDFMKETLWQDEIMNMLGKEDIKDKILKAIEKHETKKSDS